jgi:dTDP-4-amino-4,6-dideoxygalactose transaminase
VLVDVDPVSFNMDPAQLELALAALAARDPGLYPLPANYAGLTPRALISVDLFGQPADYQRLLPLARDNSLLTLEDAAQAFGARYQGRRAPSLGCQAGITSFFPAKPLGCYGDGGAVFTDDGSLAASLQSIRVHGQGSHKYDNVRLGLAGRLDTLQAAVLLPKLAIFDQELEARQRVAAAYARCLAGSGVIVPEISDDSLSVWAQYSILTPWRDQVAAALRQQGIPTNIYYPRSLHQQPALAFLGYPPQAFAAARGLSSRILSLPMHPYLGLPDQERICEIIIQTIRKYKNRGGP